MLQKRSEFFTSRLGFFLSLIGVAVGAGNIWRFSWVVAQNGGGSFLIPWVLFLFIWSIPLIIAEIALGKKTKKNPIGALVEIGGPKFAWMGAFVALVATGILFYYSVVVGWGFRYFLYSINGTLNHFTNYKALWDGFIHSPSPLFFHALSLLIGCFVIYKGIVKGVERSNKILIPTLLLLIFVILVRALTLPGAMGGIKFLFSPHLADLKNYKIWIEALIQNAWDTGAGWGLFLVYAGYAHTRASITKNGCLVALVNNGVSLLMALLIFSTVFAIENVQGIAALTQGEGSNNTGLTFMYLPHLFQALPGGEWVHTAFAAFFFLAFSFAALSSLISMIQLTSQTLFELGLTRKMAIGVTGGVGFMLGAPSALSMAFFENQDWVWSTGLIVSGLFISIAVIRFGVERYRQEVINPSEDFKMGKFYNILIGGIIPAQALILIGWSFYQSISHFGWGSLGKYGIATLLAQWGMGMALFLFCNKWMGSRSLSRPLEGQQE